MQSSSRAAGVSRVSAWTGRILSALVAAFLLFDAVAKVIKLAAVVKASAQFGFDEQAVQFIGVVLLVSTLLYIIPVTSVLGAILLTGYFGGAVVTHLRNPAPAFPMFFAFMFGVLAWLGLFLREGRLHALVPLRRKNRS